MQILHPFAGSVRQYLAQLDGPHQHRPACCPQCQAKDPLTAHGFYIRTIIDTVFDGPIRVRRYLCEVCRRTVSLLPEFALPYLRSSLPFIAWWLVVRFFPASPPPAPAPPPMPYQRGQFWLRRFRAQAEALCAALAALTAPVAAPNFAERALTMLTAAGWTRAHRFLFADLRRHLLGWPTSLAPDGRRFTLSAAALPAFRSASSSSRHSTRLQSRSGGMPKLWRSRPRLTKLSLTCFTTIRSNTSAINERLSLIGDGVSWATRRPFHR